ncbi:HD-GYP domain-containing protein [Geothrix sp. PMB-07]|uniref:HD-GYP domain-containing protein n=1 Tax=Geothrix sp. PMB-07 TaxID=3068640 RepID=UPI002740366E|nr:HD domain-containing phosphohydrolase [Geothrix sp. PMB-07]WLT32020.1 HD domain-containing protein [Geothrix sp. PMB-07]
MTRPPDLRQVIHTLSDALDLVGVDDVGHGKRVGLMAAECGRAAGLGTEEIARLFDLGMLHDIGVSSTQTRHNLLTTFSSPDVQAHCDIGSGLLSGFPPLASLAPGVKRHHTPWVQLVKEREDPTVAWQANLVFLVDRVDSMAIPHLNEGNTLLPTAELRERIRQRSGLDFNPELVALFLEASRSDAFWFALEPGHGQALLEELRDHRLTYGATLDDLRRLAELFARIVDAKSPFTAEHSLGVAGLASLLAEKLELGETSRAKLEIAGLLHDVGKLRVPNHILDKPGELDAAEREIINTHSFETFQLLRHLHGLEDIAVWAAHHHEEPGGGGYPFQVDASTLPLEARILRIADIFQAMVQDRPYHRGLDKAQAFAFMADLAARGLAEARIVDQLAASPDEAMAAARAGLQRVGN